METNFQNQLLQFCDSKTSTDNICHKLQPPEKTLNQML